MSTISAQVSDINVADIEKDNKNGNIMAESEFKKEEAPAITETAEEVVTTNTEATVNSDETTRAREWFATLSTEDQVVALGFVDPDFLETLVSRKSITSISAAPSSRPSACGGNPTMDGHPSKVDSMGTLSPDDSLEKVAAVNSSVAESDRQKDSEIQSTAPLVSDDEATVEEATVSEEMASKGGQMNEKGNVSDAGVVVSEEEKPNATETSTQDANDDFRIRDSGNEGQQADRTIAPDKVARGEQKNMEAGDETPADESSTPKDALLAADTSTENEQKEPVLAFMENVISVSPSAFQLVSIDISSSDDAPSPVLSLHPSYLSRESGQETLSALDEIMSSGKFMSEPMTSPSPSSTPLHMLLLLRFQLSVLQSYRDSLDTADSTPTTSSQSLDTTSTTAIENENEVGKEAAKDVTIAGNDLQATEATLPHDDELQQSNVVDGEVLQAPKIDAVASQQQDMEKVVEAKTNIDVSVGTGAVVALLPSLLKRITSAEKEGKDTGNIILDLARLLEVSTTKGDNLDETLKAIDQDVAQRIGALQENMVGKEEPEGTPSSTTISALDQGGSMKEESSSSKLSDTPDDSETQAEVEGFSETSDSVSEAGGKKNYKKKKKKKKRKGGGVSAPVSVSAPAPAASPEVEDEKDEEKEAVVESPVAVLPVDKVDESTQTDGGSTHVIDIPIPEESEIVPAVSIVSDKALTDTVHSDKSIGDEDTLGASSEAQKEDEKSSANAGESEDGLQISKMDGVGTVVVTPSSANESSATDVPERSAPVTSVQPSVGREDDHDEWETVEVRTRGNRKKSGDRGSNGRFSSLQSHGKKNKNPRTSESRKRIAKRKMVRDILYSVLDSVDEQVRRRKQGSEPSPRPIPNAWGTLPAKKKGLPTTDQSSESAGAQPPANQRKDGATMRDVIMGKQSANVAKVSNSQQGSQRGYADRVRQRGLAEGAKKTRDKTTLVSPTAADQNTAPTVPETLSAVSTASAITETPSAKNTLQAPGLARSESSSSESIEATKPQSNSKQPSKEVTPSPPLPTLLSPGNANSATSSVASSLDAPHVVHHHSSFPGNENDVGYHLLRVCDRLTREIAQFMKRRDQALKIRRHERGLVLGALQDSLSTLWPSGCKVEMYGSCATDLDLPSSDLDVVVCGLDESEQAAINAENQDIPGSPSESDGDVKADTNSIQSPEKAKPQSPPKSTVPQSQYAMPYPRMTTNAERVMTLAMELERQPWAVHVKAIPTASVPVIKILADPARLQGTAAGDGDWLVQQPQSQSTGDAPDQMPWRGADVVNGLLKVDITFEGPEHGGIGSTKFSTRVVEEFSEESGLPPDGTAEVQVLMVLKELLAQRRLNEPFSGGLSSYALLLLAISVVRERAIIRKELERVERQRKLVDAGGGNAVPRSGQADSTGIPSGTANTKDANFTADAKKQTKGSQKNDKSKSKSGDQNGEKSAGKGNTTASQRNDGGRKKNSAKGQTNQQSGEQKPSKGSSGQDATTLTRGGPASSSWASIAKKSSAPLSRKDSQDSPQSQTHTENKPPPVKKMSSFAEAVAKGNATSQENNDSNKSRTKKTDPKPKGADSKKGKGQDGAGNKKTDSKTQSGSEKKKIVSSLPVDAPVYEPMNVQSLNASSPTKQTASSLAEEPGSFFPQSFHDVIEVLCSGETTSGKLLMHFLLFYGQHFDSHSTAIDYSNTHERDPNMNNGYAVSSPYLQRRNTGNYDPMTGMYTVDPIVVYDPLVGAENNNVSRSCFAWSSIRWVFAQSYMTLSSAVEMSAGHQPGAGNNRNAPPAPPQGSGNGQSEPHPSGQQDASVPYASGHDESGNVIFDASTPLLELLLSF